MSDPDFLNLRWEEFRDCIVLFDDFNQDGLDKTNKRSVEYTTYRHTMNLLNKLMQIARKENVHVIIILHEIMNYQETRSMIKEADYYVLFPRTDLNSVTTFFKTYIRKTDNKKEISRIENITGPKHTPLIIHKSAPRFMMSDKFIQLV